MTEAVYPPGPKTRPLYFIQNLFHSDPIGLVTQMASYGDISHMQFGDHHLYLLNDPDLIRDVLVSHAKNFIKSRNLRNARSLLGKGLLTSEGELHLRQRRLAAPAFHHQRIASYAATMAEYTQQARERWQPGEVVNITAEMMRLTLSIAGKTLFDADVENEAAEIGAALTAAMEMFLRSSNPLAPLLDRLPLPSNTRAEKGYARLNETIYRLIAEHRAHPGHNDLLEMLLSAQDPEGDHTGMTDLQLRDEAMTIFLAGHETTAVATTWAWYALAQNPAVEQELHREVDQVLGGRLPSFEDIPQLNYTRMVFAEAMRMYPPAFIIGREALQDYPVREYVIPAKATVLMSQYVMHHDPRYYPDPDCFDPLRFTPEAEAQRPKFAYFPFGGGPRVCIGESFAWTEGVLILAALTQCWQPRLVAGQNIGFRPMVTLRPDRPVWMRLEPRDRA